MMQMKEPSIASFVMLALVLVAAVAAGAAGPHHGEADLSGFQEIPTLSTPATGSLSVSINREETTVSYALSYDGFETDVTQAHIHLGRPAFSGGIMAFLCTNGTPPAGAPAPPPCPVRGGSVSGVLSAADVIGPSGQGVAANEFGEFIDALRAKAAYGNVHTTRFPAGEIRGQIRFDKEHHDNEHHDKEHHDSSR
jgi:hypothetical protein